MANEAERAKEIEDAVRKSDADKARKDAEQGEMLDKVLKCMDAISSRMDAWEEKEAKKDAEEAAAREESDPTKVVADADGGGIDTDQPKPGAPMNDSVRLDSVRKIYVDAHGDPAYRRDHADSCNAYRDAALSIQYDANRTYNALGTAAPPCLEGTSLRRYDAHLVAGVIKHSRKWADLDASALERMDATTFKNVKAEVYADAYASATDKNRGCEGDQLREYITSDAAGRRVVNFAGESRMWLDAFAGNRQRLVGIRTRND